MALKYLKLCSLREKGMKDIDAELAAVTNNWNRKYTIYKQRNTLSWLFCSLLLEALLVLVGGIQHERRIGRVLVTDMGVNWCHSHFWCCHFLLVFIFMVVRNVCILLIFFSGQSFVECLLFRDDINFLQ